MRLGTEFSNVFPANIDCDDVESTEVTQENKNCWEIEKRSNIWRVQIQSATKNYLISATLTDIGYFESHK